MLNILSLYKLAFYITIFTNPFTYLTSFLSFGFQDKANIQLTSHKHVLKISDIYLSPKDL